MAVNLRRKLLFGGIALAPRKLLNGLLTVATALGGRFFWQHQLVNRWLTTDGVTGSGTCGSFPSSASFQMQLAAFGVKTSVTPLSNFVSAAFQEIYAFLIVSW